MRCVGLSSSGVSLFGLERWAIKVRFQSRLLFTHKYRLLDSRRITMGTLTWWTHPVHLPGLWWLQSSSGGWWRCRSKPRGHTHRTRPRPCRGGWWRWVMPRADCPHIARSTPYSLSRDRNGDSGCISSNSSRERIKSGTGDSQRGSHTMVTWSTCISHSEQADIQCWVGHCAKSQHQVLNFSAEAKVPPRWTMAKSA